MKSDEMQCSTRKFVLPPKDIEPMITMGSYRVHVLGDDWTAVTVDGKPAAHFEHTVVVTENGPEILTMRDEPRLN